MSLQSESFAACISCHSRYSAETRYCQRLGCIDGEGGMERLWLVTPYPALAGFRKWWPPDMRDCAPAKYQHARGDDELMLLEERINAMRGALIEMLRQDLPAAELDQARTDLRAMLLRRDILRADVAAGQQPAMADRVWTAGRHLRSHRTFPDNGNSAAGEASA